MAKEQITVQKQESDLLGVVCGILVLIVLTVLVAELDTGIAGFFKDRGVSKNPFEYHLTALVIGLIANGILRSVGWYRRVQPAIRTGLFLNIGLVLLGARISFGDLLANGIGGLLQAIVIVTSVFLFTWWLGGKFNLPPTLKAVMASAVYRELILDP